MPPCGSELSVFHISCVEPARKKLNRKQRYAGVIHSLQVHTFLVIFEIGVRWVTSSLITGGTKRQKRHVRMGERCVLKIYGPSRSFLRVQVSAKLASSMVGDT